jgi:hypothetical protein
MAKVMFTVWTMCAGPTARFSSGGASNGLLESAEMPSKLVDVELGLVLAAALWVTRSATSAEGPPNVRRNNWPITRPGGDSTWSGRSRAGLDTPAELTS